ncbi:hypothetical protein [Ammoniphilus sp. CFH 90114]|uniref:hypothetical protein n=1 Tax=Ammoniphilus sp. CFH 90114 TaxID=2493665 RepID=UPI00100E8599|nr:hypothetical protein [Ammoniphilus sp. CFH 90114]RXT14904.1 hypothetical protein EIZ39_01445 [Ammoniphilus sp. CFH 90114]
MAQVHVGAFVADGHFKHTEVYYEVTGQTTKNHKKKVLDVRVIAKGLRGQSVEIVWEDSDDEKTFTRFQTVHLTEGINDCFVVIDKDFFRYRIVIDGDLPVDRVDVWIR